MNNVSPFTVKSRDTYQLSESEGARDERMNLTQSRKSSNDLENIDPYMHKTQIRHGSGLNSDLAEQCDFRPEHEGTEEHKITNSDGTIRFVATEVVSGKIKKDLCHQSHVSEQCSSELSNSINHYDDVMGASIENSVENSVFIRNLMLRRELSPTQYDHGYDNEVDNEPRRPHIHVGTLSEESEDHFTENSLQRSDMDEQYRNLHGGEDDSNIQITDPDQENMIDQSSGDHIRVENNSEEEEHEVNIRYPPLQEIQEDPD